MSYALRLVLGLLAVLPLACFGESCCEKEGESEADSGAISDAEIPEDARRVSFQIEGMSCAMDCAPKVKAALEGVEGVERATIDFEEGQATVVCAVESDPSAMRAAVDAAGFKASQLP